MQKALCPNVSVIIPETINLDSLKRYGESLLARFGKLPTQYSYKSDLGENWRQILKAVIQLVPLESVYIHTSNGNDKIGDVWNFSLPAGDTCSACALATCWNDGCYAKDEARYASVIIAREENLRLLLEDFDRAQVEIRQSLIDYIAHSDKDKKVMARLHESGDFAIRNKDIAERYVTMWLELANEFPDVGFYTYTKAFDTIRPHAHEFLNQDNFELKLSAWTGMPLPEDLIAMGFSVAYCDDGIEDRIKPGTFVCPATLENGTRIVHCDACGKCGKPGDVCFIKHGSAVNLAKGRKLAA